LDLKYGDYLISDDKLLIQSERVYELLSKTYWANNRLKKIVEKSIKNSFCFGLYKNSLLIGFARCVTDFSTLYYLADVVIDENYRGQGLGKLLTKFIAEHEVFSPLLGILETKDAHGLYEKFGFQTSKGFAMRKDPLRQTE
jgi:GNAT superfamily N-acetyltransferase